MKKGLSGLRKRLFNSRKVILELIEIVNNAGNDLIDHNRKEGKGSFVVYPPPKFEEIISKNATIVPMPIIFAYLPPVYFRIFSRIIIGTLNPETMQSEGNVRINAEDLLDSLSVFDRPRFAEVIQFLIKYKFLYFAVHPKKNKKDKELLLLMADPYRHHYCGLTVSAMSVVAKTHMANTKKDFLDEPKYKWREWKKIKPVVINYDDLEG